MYAIISNGTLIALCDHPRYVRKNPSSGAYIQTSKEDAEAVAVHGTLYNINGGNAVVGAPQAIIREEDGAEYIFKNRVKIEQNETAQGAAIVSMEDALCEQDAANDERMSALEDALCELDMKEV